MNKLDEEIEELKRCYPQATYIGVADGAKENWRYLAQHTSAQILDFYHASEYLAGAAEALLPESKSQRKLWLEDRLHCLKNKRGAARKILAESYRAVSYFTNNQHLMKYQEAL